MDNTVLITGGAGFIGSHLADELIRAGYRVRVLDNLSEQVHEERKLPSYLNENVEFIAGDVRDRKTVDKSLGGVSAVFHFAASVGVGQSMYEIRNYTDTNNMGTATLMEALIDNPVDKLVVASSMSIYGEGFYRNEEGHLLHNCRRNINDLRNGDWELYDKRGKALQPVAVTEDKNPSLSSVYALSKFDQERLALITGEAYGIRTTALRFFNVYGTRQALSNPYTGVLAIFATRLLNNKPPLIFEDGEQQRDFIHVKDVARACRLAMETRDSDGEAINVGSGRNYSIKFLAEALMDVLNKSSVGYEITGKYRVGDIRHCFADMTKANNLLGFTPQVELDEGMRELAEWLKGQVAIDRVEKAGEELKSRGLTV